MPGVLINLAAVLLCVSTPSSATTVCYDDLGCFSDDPPFNNAIGHLPQSPAEIGTRFFLYTKAGASPELLDYNDPDGVNGSTFDPNVPTKIIIHGFMNTAGQEWVTKMREAFLATGKYNVIVVGWGNGAFNLNYPQVVSNTRVVARQIAKLLEVLQQTKDLDLNTVHLIGFSVGAHLAGLVTWDLGYKVGRITGMDPAGPLFQSFGSAVVLDRSDAIFVDIYHTDAQHLGAGTFVSTGHVDFYPNGGASQTGCNSDSICDHSRSHAQFIASIYNSCPVTSFPCPDQASYERGECVTCGSIGCNTPGLYVNTSSGLGNQFYATTDAAPFCGQNYQITIHLREPLMNRAHGNIQVSLFGDGGYTSWIQVAEGDLPQPGASIIRRNVAFKETIGPVRAVLVAFNPTPRPHDHHHAALIAGDHPVSGLESLIPTVVSGLQTVQVTKVWVQPVPDGRPMSTYITGTLAAGQSFNFYLQ